MKTAENWHHTGKYVIAALQGRKCNCESCQHVRAIQLDAFKAGMEYAAKICNGNGQGCSVLPDIQATCEQLSRTILTTAQQLKEIPK